MTILGIDPGTATTGFGIIQCENSDLKMIDYGCIETPKHLSLAERLHQIAKDLDEIVDEWHPDEVAIEELFFSKNVKTAIPVAHARGAIMQKLSERGYTIYEYKPVKIKEAVCGYGRADKSQVQKMVQHILEMAEMPRPDDAADALAVAICHSNMINYEQLQSI